MSGYNISMKNIIKSLIIFLFCMNSVSLLAQERASLDKAEFKQIMPYKQFKRMTNYEQYSYITKIRNAVYKFELQTKKHNKFSFNYLDFLVLPAYA